MSAKEGEAYPGFDLYRPPPEGIQRAPGAGVPDARVTVRPLRIPDRTGLADQLDALRFFAPGPLYLSGGFTDERWADLISILRREIVFETKRFERPVFRGMTMANGDPTWNHAVWGAAIPDWPDVSAFLRSVRVFRGGQYAQVVEYEVPVPDPAIMDRKIIAPSDIAIVPVAVFLFRAGEAGQAAAGVMTADDDWVRPAVRGFQFNVKDQYVASK